MVIMTDSDNDKFGLSDLRPPESDLTAAMFTLLCRIMYVNSGLRFGSLHFTWNG